MCDTQNTVDSKEEEGCSKLKTDAWLGALFTATALLQNATMLTGCIQHCCVGMQGMTPQEF